MVAVDHARQRRAKLKVWRDKGEKTLEIKIGETPDET